MKLVGIKQLILIVAMGYSSIGFCVDHMVEIVGFKFNPSIVTVVPGDRVIFVNKDGAPHSVVPSDDTIIDFEESGILSTGDEFILEIEEDESIKAQCGVHPMMPGVQLIVQSKAVQLIESIRQNLEELENEL